MERKDYADKFRDIKIEILEEIRKMVPENSAHRFSEKFYVHYIEGEVATTDICSAVEVWCDGMVVFIVHRDTTAKDEVIEGESVFMYEPDSFLDILDHLKKDIREKKLSHLRDIVKKNGGSIDFDGTFDFIIHNSGDDYICQLTALRLSRGDTLEIDDTCDGDKFTNPENELPLHQLDKLIAYVESKTKRKFVVRVSGSFSRTFDIVASTYEEALAEAKKDWEINPLRFDDSNGEDWEDYTALAH